jgi:hypothetical protein
MAKRKAAVKIEVSEAENLIFNERSRQIENEGWSLYHDNGHVNGELLRAAKCYWSCARMQSFAALVLLGYGDWPWDWAWFKPWDANHRGYFPRVDQLRCLVKAGALALAEEERCGRWFSRSRSTLAVNSEAEARAVRLVITRELSDLLTQSRTRSK